MDKLLKQMYEEQKNILLTTQNKNDKLIDNYIKKLKPNKDIDNNKLMVNTYDNILKNTEEAFELIKVNYTNNADDVIISSLDEEFKIANEQLKSDNSLKDVEVDINQKDIEKIIKIISSKGDTTDIKRFDDQQDYAMKEYEELLIKELNNVK